MMGEIRLSYTDGMGGEFAVELPVGEPTYKVTDPEELTERLAAASQAIINAVLTAQKRHDA